MKQDKVQILADLQEEASRWYLTNEVTDTYHQYLAEGYSPMEAANIAREEWDL